MGYPNNPDLANQYVSLQTGDKAFLLKITPIHLTEHGEVKPMPVKSLHTYWLVLF